MKKRRKYKDNPYILENDGKDYFVQFKDSKNVVNNVSVTKQLYEAFDRFELDDLKELNEYDRHTEHFDLNDEEIYKKGGTFNNVENLIDKKLLSEDLVKAIGKLSTIQKQRIIKYYFDGKNEYKIAKEENITHQAVNKSLKQAREKLKEILKKLDI